jgi:ketol-acid reductoisomerase
MKHKSDLQEFSSRLTGTRVAVLGYGPSATEHARGLRDAGNEVLVGSGGMSGVRARKDGFPAKHAVSVVEGASVVVVLVPDEEQSSLYWAAIEPNVAPGALLVFGRALALQTKSFEPEGVDVVFVASHDHSCRVAVHNDATGRALERAIAYVRSAFGPDITITTTTISAEVEAEIAALETRAGGAAAYRAEVERDAARVRDSHAPEEARVSYYEGLRELLAARAARTATAGAGAGALDERGSAVSLVAGHGARRGMS